MKSLTDNTKPSPGGNTGQFEREIEALKNRVSAAERENARLRAKLFGKEDAEENSRLIAPERMVWSFGYGRTGSSWLNGMLKEPEGHFQWGEPLVGTLFADMYLGRAGKVNRENRHFIMSEPLKDTWLASIRSFVLEGASARFPEAVAGDGYLMVNEPNGSLGAPLVMAALPESRMVLLVRDPRDVVASFLDANRSGGWLSVHGGESESLADRDPDLFVEQRAAWFMESMEKAREAYEAHPGEKAILRYEDLRSDPANEMRRLYLRLGIEVEEAEVVRSVEKFSWENMTKVEKGRGKFFRKASPGGWREDLTEGQAAIIERIAAPLLAEFYPSRRPGP